MRGVSSPTSLLFSMKIIYSRNHILSLLIFPKDSHCLYGISFKSSPVILVVLVSVESVRVGWLTAPGVTRGVRRGVRRAPGIQPRVSAHRPALGAGVCNEETLAPSPVMWSH